MSLVLHCICAYPYAVLRVEAAGLSLRATTAMDVVTGYIAAQLPDVILEKSDYGTWTRRVISVSRKRNGNPPNMSTRISALDSTNVLYFIR